MEKADAILYFPVEDINEIDDLYEELIFQQKQFFLNRVPTSKLFKSKLSRLKKMEEAFVFFGGEVPSNRKRDTNLIGHYAEENISICVHEFQQKSNEIKLALMAAENYSQIDSVLSDMLKNYLVYSKKWNVLNDVDASRVVLSKQPDEMALIMEIKKCTEKGIVNFNQINELDDDNILVQESIRLSLWLNLENDV